jgi:PTH1 family peptidyl-tRNA hydrolase
MKIVVGLGNPGERYKNTRHNLGFMVIDRLAKEEKVSLRKIRAKFIAGNWQLENEEIKLVKPLSYMNNSGVVVANIVSDNYLSLENLLVICDDFQLSPGKLRIRPGGSSGGHNGIDSIIQNLGSEQFPRLRIGVGLPKNKDAVEYVLGNFSSGEKKVISKVMDDAVAAVKEWILNGIESSMNKFN